VNWHCIFKDNDEQRIIQGPNQLKQKYLVYVLVPIALATYSHLWNPLGFPSIHADENTYIFHALEVQEGKGVLPRGAPHYDHPYFGRIFLASVFDFLGYPDIVQPSPGKIESIEMLHLVPRILMGVLAVVDTFLVYKIAERRYNSTVAVIASILFAVMPSSWLLERILLDNFLVPFLLSSILFAVGIPKSELNNGLHDRRQVVLVLISGIFLGLAVFTKIPAFTFIPIAGFLVFSNTSRSFRLLGLWLGTVIIIPSLWVLLAASAGQFDSWLAGIAEQATGREDKPLVGSLQSFFRIDPVLLSVGALAVVMLLLKKDIVPLLWVLPYLAFFYFLSFSDIVHMVMLLPPFCIGFARLLDEGAKYLISRLSLTKLQRLLPYIMLSPFAIFALLSMSILLVLDINGNYFLAYNYTVEYLSSQEEQNASSNPIAIIGRYWTKSFLWIPQLVFDKDFLFIRDDSATFHRLSTQQILDYDVLLIADNRIMALASGRDNLNSDDLVSLKLKTVYDSTEVLRAIEDKGPRYDRDVYPYTSLNFNRGIGEIEIRSNAPGKHAVGTEQP
jgi:Dolichyl-phosphate-mannose-protein mannosyltransferase